MVLAGTAVGAGAASPLQVCAAAKMKCVAKKTHAVFACHVKAESKGVALDANCIQRAKDKFTNAGPPPGCMEKAEAPGGCLAMGDGPHLGDDVDAFVTDVVGDVDPGFPTPVKNKCSAAKKKCMDKKVSALFLCQARAFLAGTAVDQACVQAASDKFTHPSDRTGCMEKAEDKKGPCLAANGDGPHLEEDVDLFVEDLTGDLTVGIP